MREGFTGGCLCGAVRYRVEAAPAMVGHCYCVDCRRTSGTSHCTHAVVPVAALHVTGSPAVYDRPADSGNMVSRCFCSICGSAVCSRNAAMPDMAFVRVSSMDEPELAVPDMTVYASRAPSWAKLDESRPVFALMPQGGPEAVLADI